MNEQKKLPSLFQPPQESQTEKSGLKLKEEKKLISWKNADLLTKLKSVPHCSHKPASNESVVGSLFSDPTNPEMAKNKARAVALLSGILNTNSQNEVYVTRTGRNITV